jgi:hypothetical protein
MLALLLTFKPGIPNLRPPQWGALASAKLGFHPPPNTWIQGVISARGSNIAMFVNGVKVASAEAQIGRSQFAMHFD